MYTLLVGCIICGLIYGLCEDETGVLPNVVRVMTIGDYSFSMATPCLLVCLLTVRVEMEYNVDSLCVVPVGTHADSHFGGNSCSFHPSVDCY